MDVEGRAPGVPCLGSSMIWWHHVLSRAVLVVAYESSILHRQATCRSPRSFVSTLGTSPDRFEMAVQYASKTVSSIRLPLSAAMQSLSLRPSSLSSRPLRSPAQSRQVSQCLTPLASQSQSRPTNHQRVAPAGVEASRATTQVARKVGALLGGLQQTRGMKVQSSVKKRCEHCKVSDWASKLEVLHTVNSGWLTFLTRLFEGKVESDIEVISTSSAHRTRDTSNGKADISYNGLEMNFVHNRVR
jgi:ribosomal protein L36